MNLKPQLEHIPVAVSSPSKDRRAPGLLSWSYQANRFAQDSGYELFGRTCKASFIGAALALSLSTSQVYAQTCGEKYTVVNDDTLSGIASRSYKDGGLWTLIYNTNQTVIGEDPSRVFPGQRLRIPCLDGSSSAQVRKSPSAPVRTISIKADDAMLIYTGSDVAPFTDQKLDKGGMLTDLLATAFSKHAKKPMVISWVNDWSQHLPMTEATRFDGAFPWYRPDCDAPVLFGDAKYRCETFNFSESLFQVLVLLFVNKDSDFQFNTDEEIIGKNICRMESYMTFDFDQNGRNWYREKKINLKRPKAVADCFDLLAKGEVDAVSINEFTGKTAVRDLKLEDKVVALRRPMSIVGMHVITSKKHPQGDQLIEQVNASVEALRESGEYDEIVEKHLTAYWQLN